MTTDRRWHEGLESPTPWWDRPGIEAWWGVYPPDPPTAPPVTVAEVRSTNTFTVGDAVAMAQRVTLYSVKKLYELHGACVVKDSLTKEEFSVHGLAPTGSSAYASDKAGHGRLLDCKPERYTLALTTEPVLRYPALLCNADGSYYHSRKMYKDEAEVRADLTKSGNVQQFVCLLTEWGVLCP